MARAGTAEWVRRTVIAVARKSAYHDLRGFALLVLLSLSRPILRGRDAPSSPRAPATWTILANRGSPSAEPASKRPSRLFPVRRANSLRSPDRPIAATSAAIAAESSPLSPNVASRHSAAVSMSAVCNPARRAHPQALAPRASGKIGRLASCLPDKSHVDGLMAKELELRRLISALESASGPEGLLHG